MVIDLLIALAYAGGLFNVSISKRLNNIATGATRGLMIDWFTTPKGLNVILRD